MSVLIALVCGIHPLQVESVAWVAARNGLLCSVWMVAALCAYVRAAGPSPRTSGCLEPALVVDGGGAGRGGAPDKAGCGESPVVMLAVDYFPLRRQQSGRVAVGGGENGR